MSKNRSSDLETLPAETEERPRVYLTDDFTTTKGFEPNRIAHRYCERPIARGDFMECRRRGNLRNMSGTNWPLVPEALSISTDTVAVIRVNLEIEDSRIEQLRSVLSPDELTRADRYKFDRPRRHFVACRAALRQILASCLKSSPQMIEFEFGTHGKPSLKRSTSLMPEIEFSVSHSDDLALIAMSLGRRVGVDLEKHDGAVRIHKLAQRFFSEREAAELAQLPANEQLSGFFRGWTCKEAYIKATGFGLSFHLNQFSVVLNPALPPALIEVVNQPDELSRWRLLSVDAAPGFSAALMFEAAADDAVSVNRWSLKA